VSYDEKCFTVRIRSLTSDKDLMEFELDVSQFVKENQFLEHQQTIVLPSFSGDDEGIQYAHNNSSSQPPRLHLVIRSYSDGLNKDRGGDFSQFHKTDNKTNPLLNSAVSVVVHETIDDFDNDDDQTSRPLNKERRGTRKISVMFNDVTSNGQQHRQSCLPPEQNTPTAQQQKNQRQSTYRFSIQAGQGLKAPKDSDDSDSDDELAVPKCNNFDDEDLDLISTHGNKNKNRLMSTVQGPGHFDIGEDSDYD
jgi:hypothetical protein